MKGKGAEAGTERQQRRAGPGTRDGVQGVLGAECGTGQKRETQWNTGEWPPTSSLLSRWSFHCAGFGAVPACTLLTSASAEGAFPEHRLETPLAKAGARACGPQRLPAGPHAASFFNSAEAACVFLLTRLIPGPPRPRPAVPSAEGVRRYISAGDRVEDLASHRLSNGHLSCELGRATGRTMALPRPPITGHLALGPPLTPTHHGGQPAGARASLLRQK